jgi:hypothetical protein
MSWDVQVPFLFEMPFDVFRCLVCRRLVFFRLKGLTSALTDQGPYEFVVSGAGDDYIDLANTYLFVEAQIMDNDLYHMTPVN